MRDRSMDLDRMDRATLRAWRAGNLIGWWLVGTVVYHAIAIVLARTFVQKMAMISFGQSAPSLLYIFVALDFAAVTAGAIVGSRVYRSPFAVAALAVVLPEALIYLVAVAGGAFPELVILALFSAMPAVLAGIAARFVWRRRPRALRVAV
jgi:hypothetical protein